MTKSKWFLLLFILMQHFAFSQCSALFKYSFLNQNKIQFYAISDSLRYSWDFGNGIKTDFKDPIHFFNKSGKYTVCLTVTNPRTSCSNNHCIEIWVNPDTCKTNFSFKYIDEQNLKFFAIAPSPQKNYRWEINNVFYSSNSIADYFSIDTSSFNVCLTTFDSSAGCTETICRTIDPFKTTRELSLFSKIKSNIYFDVNTNQYKINLQSKFSEPLNLRLISVLGQTIQDIPNLNSSNLWLKPFNATFGIYLYVVDYKGFIISSGQFIP